MAIKNSTAVIDAPQTLKTPKSVYPRTVEMQDDSMVPIFVEGDVLTIDGEVIEEEGDYVLVRTMGSEAVFSICGNLFADELYAIRRYTSRRDGRAEYVPENPAYPTILEHETWSNLELLGIVTSVRRIDGTVESFDSSTRMRAENTK